MKLFLLQKSKQNNFKLTFAFSNLTKHVNSLTNFGQIEENMDPLHIHLAVTSANYFV